MKNIHEISLQLEHLYQKQKQEEEEVFEQLETLLVNASPLQIINNTIDDFLSSNQTRQDLPKKSLHFLMNKWSDRFLSDKPIIKDVLQTVLSDILFPVNPEKKSKNPGSQIQLKNTLNPTEKNAFY